MRLQDAHNLAQCTDTFPGFDVSQPEESVVTSVLAIGLVVDCRQGGPGRV